MVPSALLLSIDNPAVGRNLSAKPKIQAEQSESQPSAQTSESFARHLEKTREHHAETNPEKPVGKLIKRHKPDHQSVEAKPSANRETQVAEEKQQSSELTASATSVDENTDQQNQQDSSQQPVDSSEVASAETLLQDINPISLVENTATIATDETALTDEPVLDVDVLNVDVKVEPEESLVGENPVDESLLALDKSGEKTFGLAGESQSSDMTSTLQALPESGLITTTEDSAEIIPQLMKDESQAAPLLAAEVNSSAVKATLTTNQPALDTELNNTNPTAKGGTELPLDAMASQSDSAEGDLPLELEMSDDLLPKGEDKTSKTDSFKFLMSQLNPADQKVQDKAGQSLNPAPAGLQSLATELTPASRLFVPQTQLGMNAANPNWGKAMGEKIMWMANQQLSSADIRLDPPELGSLQVKISVQQDQATVTFVSPHPQVRELLDQQVNRLREMFAEQGLQLGQVNVADKREQQSGQSDDQPKSRAGFAGEDTEEVQVAAVSSLYLVDQFV